MTALVYAPTLAHGFVYEDLNADAGMLRPWSIAQTLAFPFRSLTYWLQTLCLQIGGSAAWPYHAASLALHLVNVALLASLAGVLAAAVFALHPLLVETVAYVSAQPDLLVGTCVLLALVAARRGWWAAVALACLGVSLSKESGLVAWLLVPLVARWRRWPLPHPVWGVLALLPASWIIARTCWSCARADAWSLHGSVPDTLRTLSAIGRYVAWTAWPVGLSIVAAPTSAGWGVLVAVAAAVGLWRWSVLRFPALWIGLALAPRLLVPYGDGLHDHHWAVPIIGICLALGAGRGEAR